ncbi:MAG: sugar O-acetyltransferase [Beduini sp.]|uniref:sugar O-acetyltransferase n=1 Tax=Beduini sp. TaxID=1922300 RepID=UPI00399F9037
MTEKEKAKLGMLYDANYDKELIEESITCRDLCYEYNQLKPSLFEERDTLIRRILNQAGENLVIHSPFKCDYGYNITVGKNFYANYYCTILDGAEVTFGNNVFIAPFCGFYTAGHPFNIEERNKGLEYAYPIKVGNDVWIGANVTVLPGVTIGDDVVIGAGSVVNKDIPSGVLAAGNPCKVIRPITDEDRNKYK